MVFNRANVNKQLSVHQKNENDNNVDDNNNNNK